MQADLTLCADGRACPNGTLCDEVHATCIAPDQRDVCIGLLPGEPCSASGAPTGRCYDGVCLPSGCGNRVVEEGEQCDDGNFESNDGCSADCSSSEVCGNGELDPGEACDDGARVNHDGCDASCGLETEQWSGTPIRLRVVGDTGTAFDAARGRLVHVDGGVTSEWDGQRWRVASFSSPVTVEHHLVYDSTRQRVILVGRSTATMIDVIAEWDGTTWTTLTGTNVPTRSSMDIGCVVYDAGRRRVLVMSYSTMFTLDPETAAWSDPIATSAYGIDGAVAAYDPVRDRVVLVSYFSSGSSRTFEWDGSQWSASLAFGPREAGWSMAYDPTHGIIVAGAADLGSDKEIVGWSTTLHRWNPATLVWETVENLPERTYAKLWLDGAGRRFLFGGMRWVGPNLEDAAPTNSILEIAATTIDHTPIGPADLGPLAYDAALDRIVLVHDQFTTGETWALTDRWERLADAPGGVTAITYAPGRGVVALRNGETLRLGSTWEVLPITGAGTITARNLVYDYARRRIVALSAQSTASYALADGASQWTPLGDAPVSNATVAFDAGIGVVTALDGSSGALFELAANDIWEPSVTAGPGYQLAPRLTRGSLAFHPILGSRLWERRGLSWSVQTTPLTRRLMGAVERDGAQVLALGGTDAFLITRELVGNETEACGTTDGDGDGAIACDDDDCWMQCGLCPPLTSCPSTN